MPYQNYVNRRHSVGYLFSKVLNGERSRDRQRVLIRGVVIATTLFVIFCAYFGWRSRLSEIVARKGSLHVASLEISTDRGSRILTDPQGLKYLEERISRGKIVDPEIHDLLNESDRWLRQGIQVKATWTFSDSGKENHIMTVSPLGIVVDYHERFSFPMISTKPPFVIRLNGLLEVPFDDKIPESVRDFLDLSKRDAF